MGSGIYSIGLSALTAARAGLTTVSHNVANAGTAGYHRQDVKQTAMTPVRYGPGFVGQGVRVQGVERSYDQFLAVQLRQAETQAARTDTHLDFLRQLDNVLADDAGGLAPAMQEFFRGVQDLASNPASSSVRSAFLSNARSLAARFQTLDQQLSSLDQTSLGQVRESISSVNALATQIARLNEDIISLQNGAGAPAPNDLIDQRAKLVSELNKQVRATVVEQDNGALNVFIGNGQSLVLGNATLELGLTPSSRSSNQYDVGFSTSGGFVRLDEDVLDGGKIAGLLEYRSTTLTQSQNAIGRLALALTGEMNRQHQMGQDLSGQFGKPLFSIDPPSVGTGAANTGNAQLGAVVVDTAQLRASDYRVSFNGSAYSVLRTSDGVEQSFSGFPVVVDGVEISLSVGAMAAGDQFLIQPAKYAAGSVRVLVNDAGQVAAAAPMRTSQSAGNTGTGRIDAGRVTSGLPLDPSITASVVIRFTASGSFDVTGAGTGNPIGVAYSDGGDISYNGWTVRISGAPKPGDTFTVSANTGGTGDGRNAVLLAELQTAGVLDGGSTDFGEAYRMQVSAIGIRTSEYQTMSEAQNTLASQAKRSYESAVGVDLDEEAAKLMRYQESYKAAAKVMQIANEMFDTILSIR
jgi:flagellar hook-associated protein 1